MILVFSHESPIAVFGNMANTMIEIQTLYVVDILTLAFLRFVSVQFAPETLVVTLSICVVT